jgi:cyclo(L-tyrosyl-L-tyrosyl) synthase
MAVPVSPTFDVRPYTPACRRLFERGEHVLIGVSPGNSYFKRERLTALLEWARCHFAMIDVVYVDLHIDTMQIAFGYTPQEAGARAVKAVRDTRRRIRRAVEATAAPTSRIRVRPLSHCVDLPGYQAVQRRIEEETSTNQGVPKACAEHVRYILRSRAGNSGSAAQEKAKLQAGLAYLHAEMPFLFNTPEVLGVPSSLNCYHTMMPVLTGLYSTAAFRHHAQGYLVVRPPEPPQREKP